MAPRLSFAPMNGLVRPGATRPVAAPPAPAARAVRRSAPELPGVTANLSETGLFIITDQPRTDRGGVEIDLRFAEIPIFLGGEVVWISPERREGRSVGFGVRLVRKPGEYLEQLRTLGLPLPRLPDGAVIGSRCPLQWRSLPGRAKVGALRPLPAARVHLSAVNKEKYGRHWTRVLDRL
jgi:hypothetical protein